MSLLVNALCGLMNSRSREVYTKCDITLTLCHIWGISDVQVFIFPAVLLIDLSVSLFYPLGLSLQNTH